MRPGIKNIYQKYYDNGYKKSGYGARIIFLQQKSFVFILHHF